MSLPRNVCFPGSNISLCVLSFSPYLLCNMSFFSLCDNISSSFLFIIWSNQCMVFQRKQSKGGVIQPVTAEIEPLEGTSPGLTTCRLFMAALVWSQRQSVYYCIFSKNLQGIHQSVRNGACIKNKSYYEIPLFFFFFFELLNVLSAFFNVTAQFSRLLPTQDHVMLNRLLHSWPDDSWVLGMTL